LLNIGNQTPQTHDPADDALINDPQALAEQLKTHVAEGYCPYRSLSGVT
jgi:hypothetical protein